MVSRKKIPIVPSHGIYPTSVHLYLFICFYSRYGNVRKNIMKTYNDIERILIGEFVSALETGNISRMKEVANVLSPFRGYSDCVSAYIEHSQRVRFYL